MDEYSLHSPFMFQLYTECIKPSRRAKPVEKIESLRKELISSRDLIPWNQLGAGSKVTENDQISIGKIALHSLTPLKYSLLLKSLIQYFNIQMICELCTSMGINSLYLSNAAPDGKVTTFEGNETLYTRAIDNFRKISVNNIEVVEGNIDETFLPFLRDNAQLPFLFIDANHTYEATLRYYTQAMNYISEDSLIVLDDIHWSNEMGRAWNEITNDPRVTISVDLYQFGLLFFNTGVSKQKYVLAY